ncbi:iron transporter, putative [Candida dubliniensis CD36]|uniref:Iron transporter, putative n=1 Tax=Candida dubliniensis (strain CD36 / ATCC MYA-646 / CBS 7987 / NCPF 3949 / NRRL Y-17841) TaxID=573826 RepID=B9W8W1_CANDC|nr:iron transporter, putative [Candida dubliniensis CD36]CAX45185.1 iron transporter, putative [Candida dubliniensis CD36]
MASTSFEEYFSIQTFLIVFRETLESAIIISVLLSFVHQTFNGNTKKSNRDTRNQTYDSVESSSSLIPSQSDDLAFEKNDAKLCRYLQLQIWIGGLLGLLVCLIIGAIILGIFYIIGSDLWTVAEHYWEGTFSIIASIIISVMGIKILRVNKMQEKWKLKLGKILQSSGYLNNSSNQQSFDKAGRTWANRIELWSEKYNMFILPFVTTLREGLEAIAVIGGIGINENTSVMALVNAAMLAIISGILVGVLLYRYGNTLSLKMFLITSTCFLYLVAAGLFSKGVWNFELQRFIDKCGGLDVSETGHGPGSYDIAISVWHVNCCNGEMQEDGVFWMVFTAILGWTNSATIGSVVSYNVYWIVIILVFGSLIYEEKNGFLPLIPISWQLKRIQKRQNLYQPLNAPEIGVHEEVRESIDTLNSETPLQR